MRSDSLGIFWEDRPVVKVLKEAAPKRTPPERTWERPDYLPGLDEALAFNVSLASVQDLLDYHVRTAIGLSKERVVYDIECYPNYFLIAFKFITSGKVVYFEKINDSAMDIPKLEWVIRAFTQIGFNSIAYDAPIAALAVAGKTNQQLKAATDQLITEGLRPADVLRKYKVKKLEFDHIDLIEVAPLSASLKIYGGRLHIPKMQDLPFPPDTVLSAEQIAIVRWYCVNDLHATETLYRKLESEVQLREVMSTEYGVDLRSKSDAQVAESVISSEVNKINGRRAVRTTILPGTIYRYKPPEYLQYQTETMKWVLDAARSVDLVVNEKGKIGIPAILKKWKIPIGNAQYQMGIGGLHSTEKRTAHFADDEYAISDVDVESYYPRIILNLGLFPESLGPAFLRVFNTIVERRLHAKSEAKRCKKAGDKEGEAKWKVIADSLKITINGSFGKFGSKWSVLYSPDLLIQTTITGQLSLLMLIERLELRGYSVLSANTDGIVVRYRRKEAENVQAIITQWEHDTQFKMEETKYASLYSRDVNNYIAVKEDGEVKLKGVYAPTGLHKNPTDRISVDAVVKFLTQGDSVENTIRNCMDIRQFVSVRKVKGGAVKNGEYLGGAIRWYYAAGEDGEIIYAKSGNKVPKSDGAKPCMTLPEEIPGDIDYERYIAESIKIMKLVGYLQPVSEEEAKELDKELAAELETESSD